MQYSLAAQPSFFMGKGQSGQSPLGLFHFSVSCVSKLVLPQTSKYRQYIPNSYCQVKMKTVLVQKWLRWFALIKLNQPNVLFKGNCLLCSCMQNTTSNVKKKIVIEFYPYSRVLAPQMKRNKSISAARNYIHRKLPEICSLEKQWTKYWNFQFIINWFQKEGNSLKLLNSNSHFGWFIIVTILQTDIKCLANASHEREKTPHRLFHPISHFLSLSLSQYVTFCTD